MRLLMMVVLGAALSACTTALWAPTYMEERISGFYVNPERNDLLVTGRLHSYVFSIDKEFEKILILSRTINFQPYFQGFSVDKENAIEGKVQFLVATKNLTTEQKTLLQTSGFRKAKLNGVLEFQKELKGRLYDVQGDLPLQRLGKEYSVMIERPDGPTDIAKKIVATPAAIAYDAVVTVPATFLIVLVMSADSL